MKNNCSVCKREIDKEIYSWHCNIVGIQDIKNICKECDMCVQNQIPQLIEEFKNDSI